MAADRGWARQGGPILESIYPISFFCIRVVQALAIKPPFQLKFHTPMVDCFE
jgi:hypothetical protein